MLCEKYKSALIEAAITGTALPCAIRAHVESCSRCAAELTRQRSLIATIDTNLHRRMNAPVPTAMLQRLGARLAHEPQPLPSRSRRFTWIYAAALVTAAALLLFALPKLHPHKATSEIVALSPLVPSQPAESPATDSRAPLPSVSLKPAVKPSMRRVKNHSQSFAVSQPEILVPPDEQIALDHYVAQGKARRELVIALATAGHPGVEPSFKGLEIPDINTADLVIQPIFTEARR
jgi:hypothetical protein